jgi:hypothetical protein
VRDETKYTLDLRLFDRALIRETAVSPQQITLCLLARHDAPETLITAVTPQQLHEAIIRNSLFYDTPEIWQRNLARLQLLLDKAAVHQLTIGTNPEEIIKTVDTLLGSTLH